MSEDREHTISKVTVYGALANLGLSALKMIAGLVGKSSAMVADAVHSLSDMVSDLVILVMVKLSAKERDKSHDYGHGKYETLATLFVSLLLVVVGARILAESFGRIRAVMAGTEIETPKLIALWAALVSILVKEGLYQWTARVGRRVNSQAMVANAWHHRSDALSSVGAALGISGAIFIGGKWAILDPIVGCVISIVILVVAVKMVVPALGELAEASLPDEVEDRILQIIESVPGVGNAHELKTRKTGPDIVVDAHIVVDPEMTVLAAHGITELVENALRDEFGKGTQVSIHVEPDIDSD